MKPAALLDSNVIIAMLAGGHEHHGPSFALLDGGVRFAISAHSLAEAYATLTRRGPHAPFAFTAAEAWAALESLRAVTDLLGLTAARHFDVVRRFAAAGGIGARLYDALIGEAAMAYAIPTLITWNERPMAGLFPALSVVTPRAFVEAT